MDVQEAVAYGLIGGFGILVITIAACLIYLYWRRRDIWLQEEQLYEQSKPKVPPDDGLDGAYPADYPEPIPYPEYPEPMPYPEYPPPSADQDIILVPPVVAPLPPVDYDDDARRLRLRVCDSDDSDEERDKKRRKKKRERKDSSSSDSSTSSEESTCCCETSECHCHNHNMTPSMMLLVQPMAPPPPPQPVAVPALTGMTMFTAAPVVARGIEDQTKVAIVGVTPVPCTPPCGF